MSEPLGQLEWPVTTIRKFPSDHADGQEKTNASSFSGLLSILAIIALVGWAVIAPAGALAQSGVEGFRSAHFGMTEAQVREAIRADFRLGNAAIRAATHPVEKTRVLQVTVRDLVPGSGQSQIAYVLGFQSKTLIQVNILWTAGDPAAAEALVAAGQTLRNYFLADRARFRNDTVVANQPLTDGRTVLFRGADEQQRTIELIVALAPSTKETASGAASTRVAGAQLRLMYIRSPGNPDIHRVGPGKR
jgi:hypothetical protein